MPFPQLFDPRMLLLLATAIPLCCAILLLISSRWLKGQQAGVFSCAGAAVSCFATVAAFAQWVGTPTEQHVVTAWNVPWIPLGNPALDSTHWLSVGVFVDSLTVTLTVLVAAIAFLVQIYSIGYMHGDRRFNRYFASLSLFSFSMMGILISSSLLTLFVFWELVGLSSYLLIGHWYDRPGPQRACTKAFIMNRVGDAGFLIGLGILMAYVGGDFLLPVSESIHSGTDPIIDTLLTDIQSVLKTDSLTIAQGPTWLTIAGVCLFLGAMGKSAQFPLQTWLPDAMEGPTPVSSIVHSATMVAAGVYLTARIYPILTPGAHLFITTIGLITLIGAACMALVSNDIKRVLAYSTMSQLGYMMLGLGTGAYTFALYHLVTHAFFKCCLFQCAGSVIHAARHEQDMRRLGGLWRKLPITTACFAVCMLCIAGAGIPGTDLGLSGFYSKDGIIAGAINYGQAMESTIPWAPLIYWGPIVVAYLTAFYMARCFALTFMGRPRDKRLYDRAVEPDKFMLVPQGFLAIFAVICSPWGQSFWKSLIDEASPQMPSVQPSEMSQMPFAAEFMHETMGYAWIIGLGAGLALFSNPVGLSLVHRIVNQPGPRMLSRLFEQRFYFDFLYDTLVVNIVKFIAVVMAWIDRHLVDGLVNLFAYLTAWLAWGTGRFDWRIVDGAVNGIGATLLHTSGVVRMIHAGRLRLYVTVLFGAVATVGFVVLVTLLLLRSG